MPADSETKRRLIGLCVAALAATIVVHVTFLPRYFPDAFTRGFPFLAIAWGSYLLFFYGLGRLRPPADGMPNMRATDLGVFLFLLAIVVSGLLDTAGLTIEATPFAHVLPALGVYIGLAFAGWGFGVRTGAVNKIAAETD